MYAAIASLLALAIGASAVATPKQVVERDTVLLTDIHVIQQYWGQVKPYNDTPADFFGVKNTGLPYGCGYEQIHSLQRHGSRYPTGSDEDAVNDMRFDAVVSSIQSTEGPNAFFGPLYFLNYWQYMLGNGLLLPTGYAQEVASGTTFWNTRGRLLYNATAGQPFYNTTFTNGTARPLPLLRTTSQERILDSALGWADGFFGPENATTKYRLLVIPEGGTENNTLASYDSCFNDNVADIGLTGDAAVFTYIQETGFLIPATNRLNNYLVDGPISFNVNDTYAMMEICSYEYATFGSSDFCGLFTEEEWSGFGYTLDLEYYYDYGFGNAVGRAQGLGYLEEVIARIQKKLITSSDSSVNSTLDGNIATFPLDQLFYLDLSHDDILLSVVTAESVAYFKENLPLNQYPPDANRRFKLGYLTPFATRLNTEVIGCAVASPAEVQNPYTLTWPGANGYSPKNAPYKFIRQTWNTAIVPFATIQNGPCGSRGDGLCSLDAWVAYQQANAAAKANYQYGCFANYTETAGNGDGAVFA